MCALADESVRVLLKEFDDYLASAVPTASLLPVQVFLCLPSRGWRFPYRLRPADFLQDIADAFCQGVVAVGDGIVVLDAVWTVDVGARAVAVAGAGGASAGAGASSDAAVSVVTLSASERVVAQFPGGVFPIGCDIVCSGRIQFRSEQKPVRAT